jgi:Uncharacterized lipoprotein
MRTTPIISTFIAMLLLGCGGYPYERHVQLTYSLASGSGPQYDGRGTAVTVGQFLDQRLDRKYIGHISSAVVFTNPDVTADNDPALWLADAIRMELGQQQYSLTPQDAPTPHGAYLIEGSVLKAFCNAAGHYTADVSFEARVSRDGQLIFTRRYSGHGDRGAMVAASPEVMNQALSDALSQALAPFVIDFHNTTSLP